MQGNLGKCLMLDRKCRKWFEIYENVRKYQEMQGNVGKCRERFDVGQRMQEMFENVWKYVKKCMEM